MNVPSRRILVADDHHDAADTTAELLRINAGYEVKVAYDGREAVEVARAFHPEAVILDINMPVMDGYQAARILRDEQAADDRLLLVALTGCSLPDDAQKASAAGFDYHLRKPLMDMKLFEMLDSFFDGATVAADADS